MMQTVRKALASYLDTVRVYAYEIAQVGSVVFTVDEPTTLLQQPQVWFQQEAQWIDELLKGLETIQRYVDYVNRWISHIKGLLQNLHVTEEEFERLLEKQGETMRILKSKTYEPDYLRWVLEDVSQEVDRLFNITQNLLQDAPRMLVLAEKIKGPFMENVAKITQTWTDRNLTELASQLIGALEAASRSNAPLEILQYLSIYCDTILNVIASTPLFVDDITTEPPLPRILKKYDSQIGNLIDGSLQFREFVRLRTVAYQRFLEHIKVILQAVLPSLNGVDPWMSRYVEDMSNSAEDLLPKIISTDTLPIALLQAEDAQNDWIVISQKLIPLRESAFQLNKLLQSPTIDSFLSADQERRKITKVRIEQMTAAYQALREALNRLSKN